MIVRYNIIIPFLKTGQKVVFVIIDGCQAKRQHGLICHTWYSKQSPWQLDFPYLHTVMSLPERYTDEYQSALKKDIILYFKKSKHGINI